MNDDSELQVPARIHQPLRDEQSLREFLLRVPTTDPRKTGREYLAAHRRSRETQVALAVVLAFWLVGGLAFFSAGQRPSVSTTPSAPASACSSVEGGLAPSASFPSTPCAAPAALAQLMRVTAFGLQEIRTADAYWGSESYSIDWKSKAVVTVAGSWTGSIDVPLTQAEIDAHSTKGATGITVVADGRELAMVVWHSIGPPGEARAPCPDVVQLPRAWRILTALLDAGGMPGSFTQFATGESTIVFGGPMGGEECNATAAPRVSISNGLIAYGIDDAGPQRPYGSRILVRSLTDGTTLRDLATATHVLSLEMWGTTVAWLEADGNWPTNLPLRVSTPPHPAAQDVEVFSTPGDQMAWALPRFSLQGGSLAWERYGTGQVWRRDLVAGAQQQVSPAGSACMLGGIEAGNVVMNCGSDTSRLEQNSTDAPWLIVWAVDTGPDLVLGLPPLQTEELSNGWIVVMPVNQQSLQAFPISSLMGQ
jgi:hypothetical protein